MKRASLPLFLVLLAGLGLALSLVVTERPAVLGASESSAVECGPIAVEPLPDRERILAPELAPGRKPASTEMDTEEDQRTLLAFRGIGHISGWVWRIVDKDEVGIPDVPVKLFPALGDQPLASDAKPIAETRTRTMGSFRFPEVRTGSYFVSVEREGCARRVVRVAFAAGAPAKVLEFVIGTSRVEGLVSALEGDARPTLELEPTRHSRAEIRWPDEQGRFAFDDLPQGEYELRVRWQTSTPGGWREDITRFELGDGALISYRVGSAVPLARWRGRVSVAGGEPPRADAVVRFGPPSGEGDSTQPPEAARFEVDESGRRCMLSDPHLRVRSGLDARGAFDVALPRKLWSARLEVDALTHRTCALGPGSLAGGDLGLDLVCPGSRVRGRVSPRRGAPWGGSLRVVASGRNGACCYSSVDAHGRYVLDGLEEGTWSLSLNWFATEPPHEPVEVRIGPEPAVVERDL